MFISIYLKSSNILYLNVLNSYVHIYIFKKLKYFIFEYLSSYFHIDIFRFLSIYFQKFKYFLFQGSNSLFFISKYLRSYRYIWKVQIFCTWTIKQLCSYRCIYVHIDIFKKFKYFVFERLNSYVHIDVFTFILIHLKSLYILYYISYKSLIFILLSLEHTVPYRNCIYNRLPEDEPPASKHVEDIKFKKWNINLLNAKLNPTCHLLALLEAHRILHVSRIRVKLFIYWYGFYVLQNC